MPSIANNSISHQLYKGVIIDAGSADVINPKGGFDRFSIDTGIQLWHTDNADYPLLAKDSQIIAQVNKSDKGTISLVAIDSKLGTVSQQRSINIPNHISAKVSDGLNQQFSINVDPVNPLSGKIQWHYKTKSAKGMLPEPDKRFKATNSYGEINLVSNKLLSVASSKILQQKPNNLKSSIEGKFINNVNGRQFKSISQEHILVSSPIKNSTKWNRYLWEVYDIEGNLIGSLKNNVSYNSFVVIGDIIIYVSSPFARYKKSGTISTPLSLNAYSLTSNNHLWSTEIRDIKFRGKVPH
jgi:hypothetical protein